MHLVLKIGSNGYTCAVGADYVISAQMTHVSTIWVSRKAQTVLTCVIAPQVSKWAQCASVCSSTSSAISSSFFSAQPSLEPRALRASFSGLCALFAPLYDALFRALRACFVCAIAHSVSGRSTTVNLRLNRTVCTHLCKASALCPRHLFTLCTCF